MGYNVDLTLTENAWMDTLFQNPNLSGMSNQAITAMEAQVMDKVNGLPTYQRFSIERVLAHEAFHLMDSHISATKWALQEAGYERINIRRTNKFLNKYYGSPQRYPSHGDVKTLR